MPALWVLQGTWNYLWTSTWFSSVSPDNPPNTHTPPNCSVKIIMSAQARRHCKNLFSEDCYSYSDDNFTTLSPPLSSPSSSSPVTVSSISTVWNMTLIILSSVTVSIISLYSVIIIHRNDTVHSYFQKNFYCLILIKSITVSFVTKYLKFSADKDHLIFLLLYQQYVRVLLWENFDPKYCNEDCVSIAKIHFKRSFKLTSLKAKGLKGPSQSKKKTFVFFFRTNVFSLTKTYASPCLKKRNIYRSHTFQGGEESGPKVWNFTLFFWLRRSLSNRSGQ